MSKNQRSKAATESFAFLAILGAIFVVLNVVGLFVHTPRLDLTARRLFTLSEGSKRLASSLSEPMEIRAYFSADLPPPFNSTERYVRDLLAEYQAASNGKIRVRFIDPNTDEKRTEADGDGVQRATHQVVENDGVTQREGYRGLVFEYLGEKKTIPMVNDTSGLEYAITTLIKQMTGDKIKVGVLSGHGPLTLEQGLTGLVEALPTYEVTAVSAEQPIPADLRALLLIETETALTETELRHINKYVMEGGSLGIFGGSTQMAFTQGPPSEATIVDTGVNQLLEPWGARLGADMVADEVCGRAPLQSQFGIPMLVPFPLVPITTFDSEQQKHPAAFRLTNLLMPYASSLSRTGRADPQVKIKTLARSSENAWRLTGATIPVQVRSPREWRPQGREQVAYVYAIEGKLPTAFAASSGTSDIAAPDRATRDVRVLVAGSGKFLRDEFLPPPQQRQGQITEGLAFALNAVDWLAQDKDLIEIRAKSIEDPLIQVPQNVTAAESELMSAAEQAQASAQEGDRAGLAQARSAAEQAQERRKEAMEQWEAKKNLYKWLNMIGLPALIVIFGALRWRSRKAKKASTITV